MAILEITLLRLKPNIELTDPALLSNLRSIRDQLGTNSRFFVSPGTHAPGTILILGAWPSLQAHVDFLESEDRDRILAPQAEQALLAWSVHVDMGEGRSMSNLPLDVRRVVSVARLLASQEDGAVLEERGQSYLDQVARKARGEFTSIFRGWRIDPDEATKELVLIVGLDSPSDIAINEDPEADSVLLRQPGRSFMTNVAGFDLENDTARQ